jgi:hypothetical protein
MGIPTAWIKNLNDPIERDNFEKTIRSSAVALSRLIDLLEEKEAEINRQEATVEDFVNTDWAFKQAYRNGQKATYREVRQLLTFVKE